MARATLEEKVEQAQYIIETYRPMPDLFIEDILGSKLWEMQIEIAKAVFKYKTVAVKTCNAVGKSYIAARIAVTYLMLHPGSIVVTTAPTWRQVTDVLWREIATAVKMSRYKLTEKEVNQAGLSLDTDWYAVGLSTKYPENFFGYHADHILVIVDEAGGVEEQIFKGVKAITPNANARVLYIGNPTNPDGTFAESFRNPRVKQFTVSAFDTPNFTANGINTIDDLLELFTPPEGADELEWSTHISNSLKLPYPALIDPAVVFERYHEWGADSPAWQALVMGEFPTQSELSLIPMDLVMMAMNMDGYDEDTGKTYAELSGWNIPDGPQEYGLDMARFGADSTVLTPRRGGHVAEQVSWAKLDLIESANRVISIIDPINIPSKIKIDDTGNGGGTTDSLIHQKKDHGIDQPWLYTVIPFNFSESALDPKFADITSELYWNLKSWFTKKMISLPYNKQLFNELVGRRWKIDNQGRIKVESKDDYVTRTKGKSPDRSDSLALAFARSKPGQATVAPRAEENKKLDEHRRDLAPVTSGLESRY